MQGAGEHRRPQPVSYPSLITANLSHSNRATTPPSLDDSCVFICFSAIKGKRHRTEKKYSLTHHSQGCYLAGGQEEERVTGVPISEWNRDELPLPSSPLTFILLFLSSFRFLSCCPLCHTQKFTRRSVLLDDSWITFEPVLSEHIHSKLNSKLGKSRAEASNTLCSVIMQ